MVWCRAECCKWSVLLEWLGCVGTRTLSVDQRQRATRRTWTRRPVHDNNCRSARRTQPTRFTASTLAVAKHSSSSSTSPEGCEAFPPYAEPVAHWGATTSTLKTLKAKEQRRKRKCTGIPTTLQTESAGSSATMVPKIMQCGKFLKKKKHQLRPTRTPRVHVPLWDTGTLLMRTSDVRPCRAARSAAMTHRRLRPTITEHVDAEHKVIQSINQPVGQSVGRSVGQSDNQTLSQSIHQADWLITPRQISLCDDSVCRHLASHRLVGCLDQHQQHPPSLTYCQLYVSNLFSCVDHFAGTC